MIYQVVGVRTQQVTVSVEADSIDEAVERAEEAEDIEIDVWDSDIIWHSTIPQGV